MVSDSAPRHVAIVGGGIMGSSTFYYLSKHLSSDSSIRVSLIEEASQVAPAASGKSGGFLALDWHGPSTSSLAALSYELHRSLAEEEDGRRRWGYREVDTLSLTFDSSKSRNKAPNGLGWVDGQHISSCSSMGGGGTTAQVTPEPLVKYIVEKAQQTKGFDLLLHTKAERINVDEEGKVKGLVVKQGDSQERVLNDVTDVIICAGPWTGSLLKSLFPSSSTSPPPPFFSSAKTISGSRAHSAIIKSSIPTTAHCLFTEMRYQDRANPSSFKAGAPEVYCREDGTVYACGGSDNVPLPKKAEDVTFDQAKTQAIVEQCAVLSPSHLVTKPTAAGGGQATLVKEQACYLPTARGAPVVAGDNNRGLYVAAGHSCWGITLGLGTGFVMSELIRGKKPSADISALR